MSADEKRPKFTMVKKILADGSPCQKCAQAEDLLRRRGLWELIDEVVYAEEANEASPGMVLAKEHDVKLAPFFLVKSDGKTEVVTSAIKFAKDYLEPLTAKKTSEFRAFTEEEVLAFAVGAETKRAEEILGFGLGRLGEGLAIAFSGAEDVVLVDMAAKLGLPFRVFCLDTGRLHPETYRFLDKVRTHYGIAIDLLFPEHALVTELVKKKGLFSFYDDGHGECCGVRKVEPLRRYLATTSGWVTGQRRDQSPTRAEVPAVVWDRSHVKDGIVKLNPLALWSSQEVWDYIRRNDVPYNELHDRGYISIGCEPCTRATRPGEHERAARWWWEEATQRECGLHKA
jgi:phosphoadenosine phosphosulfate reductase